MSLLDTFQPSQLNNYAYAALLKVNEVATEEYSHDGIRHNGVRCAMSVLERMKVREVIICMRCVLTLIIVHSFFFSLTHTHNIAPHTYHYIIEFSF